MRIAISRSDAEGRIVGDIDASKPLGAPPKLFCGMSSNKGKFNAA